MAFLRVSVGRCPDVPAPASLVGTLAMKSEESAALWAHQDAADKGPGQVLVSCLPALETEASQAPEPIGSRGPAAGA